MIFTAAIALLAAIGSVSANSDSPYDKTLLSEPTVTKIGDNCYRVTLESIAGPMSANTCGPHPPVVTPSPNGCFGWVMGNEGTVLCRDGTAKSATSQLAKRSIRPQVRKIGRDCYNVSLNSKKGKIETRLCGPRQPQIRSLPRDCFSATLGRTSATLCIDGTLTSSTSETRGRKNYY
ncbi:hypothetical protein BKA69DRAFT_1069075 [Paraphysoderma sedebokerense]|nr:hypothetical protein BKA69DRAFT_1069075 [Paraphysoderma sedebokerense]